MCWAWSWRWWRWPPRRTRTPPGSPCWTHAGHQRNLASGVPAGSPGRAWRPSSLRVSVAFQRRFRQLRSVRSNGRTTGWERRMRKNLRAVAAGGALAFALAGAVSPAVAGGSAYPVGGAAGPVLAATNGDIHVNGATASGDPDDGGQLPAATTGDVRMGNGS